MILRTLWVLLATVVFLQQVTTQRVVCHHADGSWHLETVGATCCDAGLTSSDEAGLAITTDELGVPIVAAPDCQECADYAIPAVTMQPVPASVAESAHPAPALIGRLTWPMVIAAKGGSRPCLATPVTIRRQTTTILRC